MFDGTGGLAVTYRTDAATDGPVNAADAPGTLPDAQPTADPPEADGASQATPRAKDGRGAPKGSRNAIKNGSRLDKRLPIGSLPSCMNRVSRWAREYRRRLEALVIGAKGEISDAHAHIINEAASAEQSAGVCMWLLRERLSTMTASDIAKCNAMITSSRTARNRAVEKLGLGTVQVAPWIDMPDHADGAGGLEDDGK